MPSQLAEFNVQQREALAAKQDSAREGSGWLKKTIIGTMIATIDIKIFFDINDNAKVASYKINLAPL